MSDDVQIGLSQVSFGYGEAAQRVQVLDSVSFELKTNERVALIGRSGSGKSTLMNLLAGLLLPDRGDIRWGGQSVSALNENARVVQRRSTIGVVYQFHHLLPEFSAVENVMLPAMLSGLQTKYAKTRAHALLQSVGLQSRGDHRPGELSGGERQRVAIARAMAAHPSVLLMDEPTGNLDEETADQILNLLLQLSHENGTSLLLVTHDRRVAGQMDRCLQLHHGHLQTVDSSA
jgi:lipoprotein-releasing system ATP-binding protein